MGHRTIATKIKLLGGWSTGAAPLRRMSLLFLVFLLLPVVATGSALLQNGGFEGGFHHQAGIEGEVADGWVAYNEAGNPTYLGTKTFAGGGWVEKIEGSNSHIILAENLYPQGLPFTAVLYQQVEGVAPGTAYSASGWFLSMWGGSAGDDPSDPYAIGKKIGIDPTGGTDPTAPSIVWSTERWDDKSWVNPSVAAQAAGTKITLFVRVWSKWQQSANQAIVDGLRLEQAPTATIVSLPTYSPAPIAVQWAGNLPAGLQSLGNFALFYDVEVQIDGGPWQPWLSKTRETGGAYPGLSGHTYSFRVRPYAIQPKGEPPQYWPPSTFVGPLSDAASTTVDAAPPTSRVHALPAVQRLAPFSVTWSGEDDSTAIAGYTLQYRVGNGAWQTWLADVVTTSAIFGQNDQPVSL
ncbi:MAG: hypothetical protein GXP41_00635, partial [Chloroflexi bacterium]|nr:hypothetical protein [Chloroflexota bacterium]